MRPRCPPFDPLIIHGGVQQPNGVSKKTRLLRAIARSGAGASRPLAGRRLFPLWGIVKHVGRRSGSAEVVGQIVELSGGRPYYLQKLAYHAFALSAAWRSDTVPEASLAITVDALQGDVAVPVQVLEAGQPLECCSLRVEHRDQDLVAHP